MHTISVLCSLIPVNMRELVNLERAYSNWSRPLFEYNVTFPWHISIIPAIMPSLFLCHSSRGHYLIYSSKPSDVYASTRPSLVQIMACNLFGAKSLPEIMAVYCLCEHWKKNCKTLIEISISELIESGHVTPRSIITRCYIQGGKSQSWKEIGVRTHKSSPRLFSIIEKKITVWSRGLFALKSSQYMMMSQMETFPVLLALVRGIHRPPVYFPHKCQWCGALVFSLIYAWTDGWANNRDADDLRRFRAHYDVTVI